MRPALGFCAVAAAGPLLLGGCAAPSPIRPSGPPDRARAVLLNEEGLAILATITRDESGEPPADHGAIPSVYLNVRGTTPNLDRAGAAGAADIGPPQWHNGRTAVSQEVDSRVKKAEERFRQALGVDPFYGPAYTNLGVTLLLQSRHLESAQASRAACQLMPRAASPRHNLGILFDACGRYGPAERELRHALELNPDDIEIIGHLARVRVRQGQRDEELQGWLETVAANDDHPAWRDWAALELTRKPKLVPPLQEK